jgi:hypothetical protein
MRVRRDCSVYAMRSEAAHYARAAAASTPSPSLFRCISAMYPGCEHAVSASAGVAVTAAATATAQDCSTLHSPILTGLLWCSSIEVLHTVVQIERRNEEGGTRKEERGAASSTSASSSPPPRRVSSAPSPRRLIEYRAHACQLRYVRPTPGIALSGSCCDAIPAADLAAARRCLLRPDATRVHIGHTWTAGGGYYLSPPEGQSAWRTLRVS